MENLEKFWDSCDENFAHISLSRHLPGYEKLTKSWEKDFISQIDFKGKSVIDYGIGGGFLGKYLIDSKAVTKYVGIDISKRSLSHAKTNLSMYGDKIKLIHTTEFYEKFNETADIFISQACVQHFPSEKYLIDFLNTVNSLGCNIVMLQIRHNNKTVFNDSEYGSDEKGVAFACQTNDEYISKKLTSYKLIKKSKIAEPSKYIFLLYEKV